MKKRNKRKAGGLTMLAGLLLLGASMALTAYNLAEQRQADASSGVVLSRLSAEIAQEAPQQLSAPQPDTTVQPAAETAEPASEPAQQSETQAVGGLVLTDETGTPVAWPQDEAGAPLAWPVDAQGEPQAVVTDAAGQTYTWQGDAKRFTEDVDGGLLPWLQDESGQTIAWPTDEATGKALAWAEIQRKWQQIVLALLPYQQYAAAEDEPIFITHPDIEMPIEEIDGHAYIGVLEIPALEISLPVMSEWDYKKFKIAPCRYVGSVYSGDIVIAAHNYDRHFGQIKTLQLGDEVRFTDVEGNVFVYAVCDTETLGKKDVLQMEAGEWDLTLFTCTPGGAKRVTVRCRQKSYIWRSSN